MSCYKSDHNYRLLIISAYSISCNQALSLFQTRKTSITSNGTLRTLERPPPCSSSTETPPVRPAGLTLSRASSTSPITSSQSTKEASGVLAIKPPATASRSGLRTLKPSANSGESKNALSMDGVSAEELP
jgi:hypothetical protein